jgi:hypothetical protein
MSSSFKSENANKAIMVLIVFLSCTLLIIILGILLQKNPFNILILLNVIKHIIYDFFANFGKSSSEIVNTSGDVVTDTGIFGLQFTNSIVHDIGNFMKGQPTP